MDRIQRLEKRIIELEIAMQKLLEKNNTKNSKINIGLIMIGVCAIFIASFYFNWHWVIKILTGLIVLGVISKGLES